MTPFGNDNSFEKWFENIYNRYFEQLYRYAYSITKDKFLSEDVVSEVFTNIWSKKPEIKDPSAYLHVAVKHQAITAKNNSQFSSESYNETMQVIDTIDPEDLLMGKELEQLIAVIIEELPPHAAIIYEMSRKKGYSYQRIADELNVSKRTVESHMYKIIKDLKKSLKGYYQQVDGISHLYKIITIAWVTWLGGY